MLSICHVFYCSFLDNSVVCPTVKTHLEAISALVKPLSAVLDLGVTIDGQLTLADQVAALRWSCLFLLHELRMVRSSLTLEAVKTLVHAFVSSCLDYCNSLLYGISDGLLTKLQTVQNAAARVVTGTTKFDRITPVLRQLHWLPDRQQISFKFAMITFKCLRGLALSYLADVCIPVSSVVGRWQLRSADSGTIVVPRTRTTISERDFAVSGPATWNSLPVELRTISLSTYIRSKTQNSSVRLPAPLRSLSNWRYIKITYSFIHSFIHLPAKAAFSLMS